VGAVLGTLLILGTALLGNALDSISPSLTYTAWIVLLTFPLSWVMLLWIYVGIWNSSTNYMASGKSKAWGYLAKFGVVIGLLQVTTQVVTLHIPIMVGMTQFVTGFDPLGTVKYEVLNDGRTLYVSGVFGNGSASTVIDAIKMSPNLKRLHLSSDGGRLGEVLRLSKTIQSRGLETYVEEQCLSFCTVLFLAGSPRYSTPNARIGFHAPYFLGNEMDSELSREAKELYRSFQLPEYFVRKIFATPNSDMWYPSYDELVKVGVVTNLTQGGASNRLQKSLGVRSAEDLKRVLLTEQLWQKFERKFPGVVDEASARMFAAMQDGKSDSEAKTASRHYMSSYQTKVIARSTPEIRSRFITLAVDQSRHVQRLGPEFCGALLSSTLDVTKALPTSLVQREVSLTEEALDSDFLVPTNYSAEAYEKYIGLVVADMTQTEISAISDPGRAPTEATCKGLVKFYEGIASLPRSQKDIVIYGILSQ
jgi:hypothetical protein